MSSKSISMIKKQRLIKQELKNFPTFAHRNQTFFSQPPIKAQEEEGKQGIKKKWGLQKGRSLDVERSKMLSGTVNNFKKTVENIKLKSSGLIKKKRNKTIKQQSFSRVSLISSQNLMSMPSTTVLNCETEVARLTEQNKKYKQIIDRQLKHIKSLELIIANF